MKRIFVLFFIAFACVAGEPSTITPEALRNELASKEQPLVIDVREPDEFNAGHIAEALLAPLAEVEKKLETVAKDRDIVLVCRSGRRSSIAAEKLAARGYTRLRNMQGGMLAWEKLGYPVTR